MAIDVFCSPQVDRIRSSVGAEYEYILHQCLTNRGIPFQTEDELRRWVRSWA